MFEASDFKGSHVMFKVSLIKSLIVDQPNFLVWILFSFYAEEIDSFRADDYQDYQTEQNEVRWNN